MRKTILKRIAVIIIVCMILLLGINLFLQIGSAKDNMIKNSQIKLNQIEQILEHNQEDTERVKANVKQDYIIRAKAAAYIVQHHPEIEEDLDEMKKIAELLQVDEFHLFDKNGVIYSGSEPKYYGISMEDGEQIGFFKPMLTDTSLELCQDVTANTAESKLMQYAAVWTEDGEYILQIGMGPERLLKAMEKNELDHIFSMVTPETETVIYAVDKTDGTILGCTDSALIDCNMEDLGLTIPDDATDQSGFTQKLNGVNCFCVFKTVEDMYIGISQAEAHLYQSVLRSMTLLSSYLVLISIVMLIEILMQINRVIISGIDRLNRKLAVITAGDLDTVVNVTNTKEFTQLSSNINSMVSSLLDTTNALSKLFDGADIEMGIYEYRAHMKRVLVTRKTLLMLQASELEVQMLLADKEAFESHLDEIRKNPVDGYSDVFRIHGEKDSYLRIQSFEKEGSTFGIIVDMTESILERRRIESERDSDLLTGLLSRRAFYSRMEQLFEQQPQLLGNAVMIMTDVDNLKRANDTYGHAFGDQLIQSAAELFAECSAEGIIASRLSGDEFGVFLYGADSKEVLEQEIERLSSRMLKKTLQAADGEAYPVRMSGGYVFYPEYAHSFRRLMRMADMAMYQVKRTAKSGFLAYDDSIPPETERKENDGSTGKWQTDML